MKRIVNGSEADLEPSGAPIEQDGDRLRVRTDEGPKSALAVRKGDTVHVSYQGQTYKIEKPSHGAGGAGGGEASSELRAPMPGQIINQLCKVGDTVEAGQSVVVIEAMKMQQPLKAPFAGTVEKIEGAVGDQVGEGQVLAVIQPDE